MRVFEMTRDVFAVYALGVLIASIYGLISIWATKKKISRDSRELDTVACLAWAWPMVFFLILIGWAMRAKGWMKKHAFN